MIDLNDACEQFLLHCEKERKLSLLTVRAYRGDLTRFVEIIGASQKLHDMSESWIERAVKTWSCNPDLKTVTVKRRAACVKAFVRWLFRRRHIRFNPLERLELEFRIPKRLPRNLQTGEIRQIVAIRPELVSDKFRPACESMLTRHEWDRLTARLAIEVLTLTGIRIGELVKVQMFTASKPSVAADRKLSQIAPKPLLSAEYRDISVVQLKLGAWLKFVSAGRHPAIRLIEPIPSKR